MRLTRGIAVACLLLTVPACMSNNKGKIVGKWQYIDGTVNTIPPGSSVTVEFTADGKFIMNIAGVMGSGTVSANYSLGMGDTVNFSNFSPALTNGQSRARDSVTIQGTEMIMKEPDGKTMRFKRI